MKSGSRILTVRSRDYDTLLDRVVRLIDEARSASARSVNAIMIGTYSLIGHHIVEFEQRGSVQHMEPNSSNNWPRIFPSATAEVFPSAIFSRCGSFI
jgi:hypothetical protein